MSSNTTTDTVEGAVKAITLGPRRFFHVAQDGVELLQDKGKKRWIEHDTRTGKQRVVGQHRRARSLGVDNALRMFRRYRLVGLIVICLCVLVSGGSAMWVYGAQMRDSAAVAQTAPVAVVEPAVHEQVKPLNEGAEGTSTAETSPTDHAHEPVEQANKSETEKKTELPSPVQTFSLPEIPIADPFKPTPNATPVSRKARPVVAERGVDKGNDAAIMFDADTKQPDKGVATKSPPPPAVHVIAVLGKAVVVADPTTKLPIQVPVGKRLPSGEIVQSVNPATGSVRTDRRELFLE